MRHDIAVVLTTVCRRSLLRAVRSLFAQKFSGRMQILIGADCDPHGKLDELRTILTAECPAHVSMLWLDIGYSTSRRHGGVHACFFGGSLRSALTLLSDSTIVMYLDDDDWLGEVHCALILKAIAGKKWAFSYSFYADGNTGEGLCVDELESVGVGRGIYAQRLGGFVRPSGLAIDKLQLLHLTHLWSCSPFTTGDGEDRLVFEHLRREPHGCTGQATVYYALDPKDGLHATRLAFMKSRGVIFRSETKEESVR